MICVEDSCFFDPVVDQQMETLEPGLRVGRSFVFERGPRNGLDRASGRLHRAFL